MRVNFIITNKKKEAKEACPWACMFVKAEGGYWCFESYDDFLNWKKQY